MGEKNYEVGVRRIVTGLVGIACIGLLLHPSLGAQSSAPAGPDWAYGVPNTPPPAGRGGPRTPDTSPRQIPDSTQRFTLAQLRDFFNVADWFPDDHPPMPDVFVHGRAPDVRGCGMCHMPNGKGRPENAPIAGLPYEYVVQQLTDFKNDRRTSADPRKTNTVQMIQAAKAMTDEEVRAAASYLASMPWTTWIRVVEADTIPKMRVAGNVFLPAAEGGTEPLGHRIVETPEDAARFELRDPHSGFVAYVPRQSVAKGAALAAGGGNRTLPCRVCHGDDLNGLGPVPGLAGRSPSYIVRQLWDIQRGTRHGAWSPLMKQVVAKLSQDDMLNLAAYAASLAPSARLGAGPVH
jgi:cytochrome c553